MNEEETPVLLARKPLRRKEADRRQEREYVGSTTESEGEDELPATQQIDPRPLAGLVVYVDVRSGLDSCENRSEAISHQLDALGATICCRLTKDTTHVVFKDGKPATRQRAEKKQLFLVSPLWVEACKRANDQVSEAKYPVLSRDGVGGNSPLVVLGRIKRFKSLQPKPLELEIAKSLEHSRKRQRVKAAIREEARTPSKKTRLATAKSSDDSDTPQDSYKLPAVKLPRTPADMGGSSNLNSVTPDVAITATHRTLKQKTLAPPNSVGKMTQHSSSTKKGTRESHLEPKKSLSKTNKRSSSGKENQPSTSSDAKGAELGAGLARKRSKRGSMKGSSSAFLRERPTLVCTSVEPQDQEIIHSIIDKLGVFDSSKTVLPSSTTHLVCGAPGRRTVNVLAGSLQGCWVLGLDWVWRSLEAGHWLPEEPFELASHFPAAQFYRLERVQRPGVPYQPALFAGVGSVFVASSSHPPPSQMEMLLTLGGAKLTSSHRKADVCVGCKAWNKEVKSVSEQWILDSITEHRRLPLDDYLLDSPPSRSASPEL